MDNITHSLFGAAVAETVWRAIPEAKREKTPKNFRLWILFVSFVSNNFPDLDYFYARFFHTQYKLAYLLHHRGHTHTLLTTFLEAFLILSGFWCLAKKLKLAWGKTEWIALSIVSLIGLWGHIFLDGMNSYGIHPFWPFFNGWLYGDTLFIIEPWIWIGFSSLLFFSETQKVIRALYVFISVLAILLSWFSGYVPSEVAFAVSTVWITLIVVGSFAPSGKRVVILWGTFCLALGIFLICSFTVRKTALAAIKEALPGVIVHDLILTPAPGNPLCWSMITVDSLDTKKNYRLRRGIVALNSAWVNVETCSKTGFFHGMEWKLDRSPVMVMDGEWEGSVSELRELAKKHCEVAEFLKFSRAPLFWREPGKLIFSDYRFEWRSLHPFSRIVIDETSVATCPSTGAPWLAPRTDLIQ